MRRVALSKLSSKHDTLIFGGRLDAVIDLKDHVPFKRDKARGKMEVAEPGWRLVNEGAINATRRWIQNWLRPHRCPMPAGHEFFRG
jgi:hypothetical protein